MEVQIVVVLAAILAGFGFLLLAMTFLRSRPGAGGGPSGLNVIRTKTTTEPGPPPPDVAAPVPDSPEVQTNRRMFLNRVMLLSMTVFGVAFGGTSLAFMWPNKIEGFGGRINAGTLDDILAAIASDGRYYSPEGRFYIVSYPHTDDESNMYVEAGVATNGIMTLYQKCAHLGCRVPYCPTSEWFECPCHGSKYNFAGEVQPGSPAPAGLWRFPIEMDGDNVFVDTSTPTAQPPFGFDTINQPPAGSHCIAVAEGSE